ncbi:MAG: hypothetical protein ABSF08_09825 [Candidatus Cybelea sp.]
MNQVGRLTAGLGCVAAFVMAGCASTGASAPVAQFQPPASSGRIHYALTRAAAQRGPFPANAYVTYDNGPVLVTPKMYLILWGYKRYGDPDNVASLLEAFAKNMGGSSHNNIYTQYYEISDSQKAYITNSSGQFGGVWSDNSAAPKTPTDADVAAEALKSIAQLGYDANGLYVVATPHGHSEVGFGTHWCSYHSYTYYDKTKLVAYANIPYMPDAGSPCGSNSIKPPADETGVDEGVTILEGHEFGEAITDPEPFTGWNGVSGEIGDYCAWHNIANDKFGTKSYTSQPMLSDATESCVQGYKK